MINLDNIKVRFAAVISNIKVTVYLHLNFTQRGLGLKPALLCLSWQGSISRDAILGFDDSCQLESGLIAIKQLERDPRPKIIAAKLWQKLIISSSASSLPCQKLFERWELWWFGSLEKYLSENLSHFWLPILSLSTLCLPHRWQGYLTVLN